MNHANRTQENPTVFEEYNEFYRVVVKQFEDRQVFSFRGELELKTGILDEVRQAALHLVKNKDVIFELSSDGGNLRVFHMMLEEVREAVGQGLVIGYIPNGDVCLSACNSISFKTDLRIAGPSAIFGFHAATNTVDGKVMPGLAEENLKKDGLNPDFLSHLIREGVFKTTDMREFGGYELQKFGVIDLLSSQPPALLDFRSHMPKSRPTQTIQQQNTFFNRLCDRILGSRISSWLF